MNAGSSWERNAPNDLFDVLLELWCAMGTPKITVVTPSFNQGEFLERTINSVLSQQYPSLEYLIIDGGSTDGSESIIRKYEKHLHYWCSEKDRGMYDAIQKGFDRSGGEVMCWINSDDLLHPGSLHIVGEIFDSLQEIEWIQGIPTIIDEKDRTILVKRFRKWSKYNFLLSDPDHVQQESTFWRRSLWDRAGATFDHSLKLAADFELWARYFRHAKLHSVRTILGGFRLRVSGQQSIDRKKEYNDEVAQVLAKWKEGLSVKEQGILAGLREALLEQNRSSLFRSKKRNAATLFDYPEPVSFDHARKKYRLGDIRQTMMPGAE